MRAFTLDSFDVPPGLRDDLPEPHPGDTELLVRVRASSVNPVDAFIAAGALKGMAEYAFPVTLGRDFAGVVEQIGAGVSGHSVGDEVFGFVLHANPTVRDGSWAELIAVAANNAAAKPGNVDFAQAGAAPLAAITAIAALDALAPTVDETVLVVGATGGVGTFFVQLAAAAGANVVAPALSEDHDYLRGIGAGELLDRTPTSLRQCVSAIPMASPRSWMSYPRRRILRSSKREGGLPRRSAPRVTEPDASTSWPSRRRRTWNVWPPSWMQAHSESRSSAATRSSRRATHSRRCQRRTPGKLGVTIG